jgi:hypothetical protein
MTEVYHRSAGGRVTWIGDLTRDEVAEVVGRAPWEWSLSLKGFAPWPAGRVRGEPVTPASLADTMGSTRSSSLWERT